MDRTVIEINSEVDIGRARRAAGRLCTQAGFTKVAAGCVMTSVSELASNVWRYAGQGTVTLSLTDDTPACLEVYVEDEGPGILDVANAMRDGTSTSGSLGNGLPGAQRLMDEFHIDSTPGHGTRIQARKWATSSGGRS